MTRRTLLAVDFSNLVYKACAAHKELSYEGIFTGGLYGFLQSLASAVDRSLATDVVLCMDTKPYLRSRDYPDYKLLRGSKQDPELVELFKESQPLVLEMAEEVGLPVWSIPGFECDDLIAWLVHRYRHRFDRIVAQSSDSDLFQLFEYPEFRMYKSAQHQLVDAGVMATMGLTPYEFVRALSLSGTHNEIEGLTGIGPKKSADIVRSPAKWREYYAKHRAMVDRNIALITLPHPELASRHPVLPRADKGRFKVRNLYRWAAQFDLTITPPMSNALEQVL